MANFAQTVPKTMVNDTVISNADTLDSFASTGNPIVKDSLKGKNDTVKKTIHQDSFLKDKVTYDAKDSMYYIPSQYYEIDNGNIRFDSSLTKKMDIKINGIYLKNPLDKNGNCCVVIKRPRVKK